MCPWYDNGNLQENVVDNICIRCRNFGKTTVLSKKYIDYKDIVTKSMLNKVLHHVGLSWIFETNKQLKYDIYEKIIQIG